MSYKNDHLLVIANKYGKAGADSKAELFETYDKLRDLTVSGPSLNGSGFGPVSNFMLEMARLFAPASFMPVLGNTSMNIPGTSYSSAISGGNSITAGGQSAFGMNNLGNYPGFPSGGAASLTSAIGSIGLPLLMGIGNSFTSLGDDFTVGGVPTGGAAMLSSGTLAPMAGSVTGLTGSSPKGSFILPAAGLIAGLGGLASSLGPYFGPFGLLAGITGNFASGYAGSVLNAYQSVTGRILNNADTILSSKIKNIETVAKQLDTQGDIVRKMLKESVEGDSKALQSLL